MKYKKVNENNMNNREITKIGNRAGGNTKFINRKGKGCRKAEEAMILTRRPFTSEE